MDERCELLKSMGAIFFTVIDDCDDMSTTIDAVVTRGKRFEGLLKKMEDYHYVERWSESHYTQHTDS